ncbi:MAG TPA: hypothetical protein PKA64_07915, partial [Myxococcota bacterium]|nr:hypothetical protein [Myxococcota bacterium]
MRAGLLLLSFVAGSAWATPLFVPAVASTATDTSTVKSVAATCPAGRVAISGGAQITGNGQGVTLTTSGPEGAPTAPNQWYGVAIGHGGTGSWGLTVNALCAVPAVAQQIQVATVTRNASAGATFVDAFASCPAGTSIIAGGARVYGAIDGAALTTSGPEGTTQWYGVATILPNVNTGMRVDAFCLPDAVWNQRITVSTSNASPAGEAFDVDT